MPAKKFEKGRELVYSQYQAQLLAKKMLRLITKMQAEVMREVRAVYVQPTQDVALRQAVEVGALPVPTQDASLADIAAGVIDKLTSKWTPVFEKMSLAISESMVDDALKLSDKNLKTSLKEVSKSLTLTMTPELRGKMDAAAQEAAALIKRVPAEYMPNVQQDIMRSITTGNGLQDLIPKLRERNIKVKNWAENVARDQTRKAYATINRERMSAAGLNKFEWIHSGGANEPRKYHLQKYPAGLNGGIFSFDDPPIIDEKTGERGFPGQLPYCGCTFRPVIEFEEKKDD